MKKTVIYIAVVLLNAGTAFASTFPQPSVAATVENVSPDTPLSIAIRKGEMEHVKKLIASGADVNEFSNGLTPLMIAVRNNHLEIVEILIAKGADLSIKNKRGMNALEFAQRLSERENISEAIIKVLTEASKK